MRRSAAKRLRESGIHEQLIMDIGGWKTRSMFDRYTITDPESMRTAMASVAERPRSAMHERSYEPNTDSLQIQSILQLTL